MHATRLPLLAPLLALSLLFAACLPSSGEMTRVALTASARPTATTVTPPPSPKPPTRTPTPVPTSDLGVDPADLEGLEITLWHPWAGDLGKALEGLASDFNRSNEWGIRIRPVSHLSYDGLAAALASAEELPDALIGYTYQTLGSDAGEALLPLDSYVDDPEWGITPQEQDGILPAFWQRDLLDGERVGESSTQRLGVPAPSSAHLLFYNQTWAEELGFSSPPANTAQLKTQACDAAQADPNDAGAGGWLVSTEYPVALGWLQAFGADVLAPGGRGYQFASPQVERAFRYLRDLLDSGCAWLGEGKVPEDEFANRRALFIAASPAAIPHQESVFADLGSRDRWTVIPFPAPSGEPAVPVYGPSFQLLESSPERQLAAWLFIKHLLSPGSQAQLARSSGFFPVTQASLPDLGNLTATYPQWQQAFDLLQYAVPEPSLPSWRTVRWAVSDAATQLFRYYFTIDQVAALAELLDDTAADLHRRSP
jgi:ABC-type glycerol-3-phosphate transport system substrate-binding protein